MTKLKETGILSLGSEILRTGLNVSISSVYCIDRSLRSTSLEMIGSGLSCYFGFFLVVPSL